MRNCGSEGIVMEDFVQVGPLSDLPDGSKMSVEVNDRIVVLVRVGDQVFCLDDVCTHDGGPLGDGDLDGYCLACPRHGALFDIRTGEAVTMPATEATAAHEVKVIDDQIWVRIND
jgi:3-phenylpropionate/trans-cinnamate dioxygenase ferredoxin subunit